MQNAFVSIRDLKRVECASRVKIFYARKQSLSKSFRSPDYYFVNINRDVSKGFLSTAAIKIGTAVFIRSFAMAIARDSS